MPAMDRCRRVGVLTFRLGPCDRLAAQHEAEGLSSSLYVREDAILLALDDWIASLTSPDALESHQLLTSGTSDAEALKAEITAVDRKISSFIAAGESGADLPQLTDQLRRRAKEREGLEARLRAPPERRRLDANELQAVIAQWGGVGRVLASADPKSETRSLRVSGTAARVRHHLGRVTAVATQACVRNRVRRGTCPLSTHVLTIDLA